MRAGLFPRLIAAGAMVVGCSESSDSAVGVSDAAATDVAVEDVQADASGDAVDATAPDDLVAPDTTPEPDVAAPTPLSAVYTLGEKAYPESVAFDPVTRSFFTSSLAKGDITKTTADGVSTTFFAGNGVPDWLTLGVQVDAPRRRVWACAAFQKTIERGEVWILDADTGARVAQVDLEKAAPKGACADLALTADGGAYVTDRQAGRVHYVPPGEAERTPQVFVDNDALDPEIIGQNGIVLSPDETVLITEKYLPARLMRIDVATKAVTELEADVAVADFGHGADALLVFDGHLFVMLDERVVELAFTDDTWSAATLVANHTVQIVDSKPVAGFSGLAAAEGAIYASRSDVILFAVDGDSGMPFEVRRLER